MQMRLVLVGAGGAIVGVVLALLGFVGWTDLKRACVQLCPYLIDNAIPIVNFVVLIFVIIGLQYVRSDLRTRTKRFERIESDLAAIKQSEGRDHHG